MDRKDTDDSLCLGDFDQVFNRNENRVICMINDIVEKEGLNLSEKDVQDVYALTMNRIPAHYVHKGTIVLNSPITKEEIKEAVRDSMTLVLNQAKP